MLNIFFKCSECLKSSVTGKQMNGQTTLVLLSLNFFFTFNISAVLIAIQALLYTNSVHVYSTSAGISCTEQLTKE